MPAARTGHPAATDLSSLGHVAPELVDVLVVDLSHLVLAEEARLPLEHLRLPGASASRTRSTLTVFSGSRLGGHHRSVPAPTSRRTRNPSTVLSCCAGLSM